MFPIESDFKPTCSMDALRQRSELLAKIREFFESRDFIHVETPLVSRDTVVDRYIEPVVVQAEALMAGKGNETNLFLQTSPEFAMKRLLAAGAKAIYQICKAFRKGESGRRHNPEFTMLEWYRVEDDLEAGMNLLAEFARHVCEVKQVTQLSYREAFLKFANADPFQCSLADLRRVCEAKELDLASFEAEHDRDQWLNLVMSEIVEPNLGVSHPEIVFHWPPSQAALANVCTDKSGQDVAERFELFYKGTELANGYHELCDADELLDRNREVNLQRQVDGSNPLPIESRMLDAMRRGLPACSGVALGIDRLMMVIHGMDSIDQTIPFPIERA